MNTKERMVNEHFDNMKMRNEFMHDKHLLNLLSERNNVKAMIAEYKDSLSYLEEKIINIIGTKKEGNLTVHVGRQSVTTSAKFTRKVDANVAGDVYKELKGEDRETFKNVFRYTPTLNLKLFKEIQEYKPELYNKLADAVTTKPAKVSLTIKELKHDEE